MAKIWWKPITVETRKTGERVVISSVDRATEYMLYEWPTVEEGKSYRAAKQALLDALEGNLDPDKARETFLAALEEGDVFVFEK